MSTHKAAFKAAIKAGYVLVQRINDDHSKMYGDQYWHPPNKPLERVTDKVITDHDLIQQAIREDLKAHG